jgi:hypothetical protein
MSALRWMWYCWRRRWICNFQFKVLDIFFQGFIFFVTMEPVIANINEFCTMGTIVPRECPKPHTRNPTWSWRKTMCHLPCFANIVHKKIHRGGSWLHCLLYERLKMASCFCVSHVQVEGMNQITEIRLRSQIGNTNTKHLLDTLAFRY